MTDRPIDRYIRLFEQLTVDRLDDLTTLATDDVRFCDPFNDTRGRAAMRRVFAKMFEDVENPRFRVIRSAQVDDVCYISWLFSGRVSALRQELSFPGVSEVFLAADGRISAHIDHWDAASCIYAKLPLIGAIVRRLRRRFSVRY